MKRILVDMSATLLHHGHVRLLEQAKTLGRVVVALATDAEILKHKGYQPELNYEQRKEILLALKSVDEVVPSPWLLDQDFFASTGADFLLHAGTNANEIGAVKLIERTQDISSSDLRLRAISALIQQKNSQKCLLTPGPANLHASNLLDIAPVFTRNDADYQQIEQRVMERILKLCGQDRIVALQGSATTAIEVATTNFLSGRVVVILSGYYSERILQMIERKKEMLNLSEVKGIAYADISKKDALIEAANWIVAVYTETADAFLVDIGRLRELSNAAQARLMIDATGSINLESDHDLADVCMFSSCKGLGGLTGAAFITFNNVLLNELNPCKKEFILDLSTYINKKTTGPAHALCSLYSLSDQFEQMKDRVRASKEKFMQHFAQHVVSQSNQPALCTKVFGQLKTPGWVLPYQARTLDPSCQIVCHLFDQFPSNRNPGDLYAMLDLE